MRLERVPEDRYILRATGGALTSFMAKRGIRDARIGIRELAAQLRGFYDIEKRYKGGFSKYVEETTAEKGRRYNTLDNRPSDPGYVKRVGERANAYRHRKNGDDADS
jgi:hypothetical protein